MTVLYGKNYPKIQLREWIYDEQFTTGAALPDTVQLAHTSIVSNSETVTSQDGQTVYVPGVDYTMDYASGTITVLDTGSMQPGTTYLIDYEYVVHEHQFDASTGTKINMKWENEILAEMVTQAGTIIRWGGGVRGHFTIDLSEIDAHTATDILRMAFTWPSGTRRIILYPRPENLPGYEVVPGDTFTWTYPGGVWRGQILSMTFKTKRTFDSVPPHAGGVGDA